MYEDKVKKGPCPKCTTSKGFVEFPNGSKKCFSCGYYTNSNGFDRGGLEDLEFSGTVQAILKRNINLNTVTKYNVSTNEAGQRSYHYYNSGSITSVKTKTELPDGNRYTIQGKHKNVQLFGSHAFPPNSSPNLVITEGEDDAMAAYQMLGSVIPCVSLVNGSSSVKTGLADNMEYVNSFKNIYLCFDADEPGRKATDQALKLLPMHKVKVMDLTHGEMKDACDYNISPEGISLFQKVFNLAEYPKPTGIVSGREAWEKAIDTPPVSTVVNYPWECLNIKTMGMRFGEVVMLTAQSGVGKSYIMNEVLYKVLTETNYNVGSIGQEENEKDFGKRLMSIKLDKPVHFKHVRNQVPKEEWDKAKAELPLERTHGHYEVGSLDIDEILAMVQYMVEGLGCKFIFYDHISMAVADQRNMDERKALDKLSTKLKALAKKLDFCCVIVSHLNRDGEIKGSSNPEKIADTWIDMKRDLMQGENITSLTVRKNRFVGPTGPSGLLYFDDETYRITEKVE